MTVKLLFPCSFPILPVKACKKPWIIYSREAADQPHWKLDQFFGQARGHGFIESKSGLFACIIVKIEWVSHLPRFPPTAFTNHQISQRPSYLEPPPNLLRPPSLFHLRAYEYEV